MVAQGSGARPERLVNRATALAIALAAAPLALALDACDTGSPAAPRTLVAPGPAAPASPEPIDAGDDAAPAPKGARALGIAVDRTSATYTDALRTMIDAGANVTSVEVVWDELETPYDAGAGADAATQVSDFTLHGPALVLDALGGKAVLELDVADDGGRRTPADLAGVAFDDPALVARFLRAQDYLLGTTAEMPLVGYVIGSRVDVADPAALTAVARLFAQAAPAARARRPGLSVGLSVSPAALSARAADLAPSWAASDFVAVRLDPVLPSPDAGLLPAPLAAANALLRAAGAAPEGKPLFVLGAGYPSVGDGGAEAQGAFVRALFAEWDRAAARVPVLVVDRWEDLSPATATRAADRSGRSDPAAVDALRTTGFHDEAGAPKPAFGALVEEARRRGF